MIDIGAPARSLAEVARQATLGPLALGDPRYVDLSAGQETRDLRLLKQYVEEQSAADRRYALAAFSGHRGCGKTTQLLRLEHDLATRFTSIHVSADESLLQDPDLDYPDLMLWLVDQLVREFDQRGHPLDERLLADVVEWFASRTQGEDPARGSHGRGRGRGVRQDRALFHQPEDAGPDQVDGAGQRRAPPDHPPRAAALQRRPAPR